MPLISAISGSASSEKPLPVDVATDGQRSTVIASIPGEALRRALEDGPGGDSEWCLFDVTKVTAEVYRECGLPLLPDEARLRNRGITAVAALDFRGLSF